MEQPLLNYPTHVHLSGMHRRHVLLRSSLLPCEAPIIKAQKRGNFLLFAGTVSAVMLLKKCVWAGVSHDCAGTGCTCWPWLVSSKLLLGFRELLTVHAS